MGYGYEALNKAEKEQFKRDVEINEKRQIYQSANVDQYHAYPRYMRQIGDSIDLVKKSAQTDTLGKRMLSYISSNIMNSTWITETVVPAKEDLDREMDDATEVFRLKTLSKSQRTKRGKKFVEKAKLQARASNILNQCQWEREEALDSILAHAKESYTGIDAWWGRYVVANSNKGRGYLNEVKSERDVEGMGTMLKDYAFYVGRKYGCVRKDYPHGPVEPGKAIDTIENMANPSKRLVEYNSFLREFEDLDLSRFDYKNHDEFFIEDGPNSFIERFAALRAFSHANRILDHFKEDLSYKHGRFEALKLKARLVNEILADYEMRASMIQSPYYTLLAGKDFQELSEQDLKDRIKSTDDSNIRLYLEAVLHRRREKNGFGMGKKSEDLLAERKKALEKNQALPRETDTSKTGLQSYCSRMSTPRPILNWAVASVQPFIQVRDATPEQAERTKELISITENLQIDLRKHQTKDENSKCYYQIVDYVLVERMCDYLNSFENYRARYESLENLELEVNGRQAEEVREYMESLMNDPEYRQKLDNYLDMAKELRGRLDKIMKEGNAD